MSDDQLASQPTNNRRTHEGSKENYTSKNAVMVDNGVIHHELLIEQWFLTTLYFLLVGVGRGGRPNRHHTNIHVDMEKERE